MAGVKEQTPSLFFAFDEAYLWPSLVAIRSAFLQSPPGVGAIVASVGLSSDAQTRVTDLGRRMGRSIEIRRAEHLVDGLPKGLPRFSDAAWARIYLDRFFENGMGRVVYLDSDTYCRRPIGHLFDVDLKGLPLAAVPDPWEPSHHARGEDFWEAAKTPPSSSYFNSGVMVVDLGRWRRSRVTERALEALAAGEVPTRSVDQDVLNAVLWQEWLPLDEIWNMSSRSLSLRAGGAHIVHFVGNAKPWKVRHATGRYHREYRALARDIGWRVRAQPHKPLRQALRAVAPVAVLERIRWRRAERME